MNWDETTMYEEGVIGIKTKSFLFSKVKVHVFLLKRVSNQYIRALSEASFSR